MNPQTAEPKPNQPRVPVGHKVATEVRAVRVFDDSTWHTLEGENIPPGRYREVTRTLEDKWLEPLPYGSDVEGIRQLVDSRPPPR